MPDIPVAPDDVPTRVAVLEKIARNTAAAVGHIDRQLDGMEQRFDRRLEAIERNQRADFRWLLGSCSELGEPARGNHARVTGLTIIFPAPTQSLLVNTRGSKPSVERAPLF